LVRCPFIYINPRLHSVNRYSSVGEGLRTLRSAAKRNYTVEKQTVYQGQVLTVSHYRLQMPDDKVIERDIVEHPESVLAHHSRIQPLNSLGKRSATVELNENSSV